MADLPIDDSASVLDEGRFGYAAPFDVSGNSCHLPPKERRAAKTRQRARQERWRKAHEVRAEWPEWRFEEEARAIVEQIAQWERARDAA